MGHFQVSSHRRYLNPLTGWLAGAKRTRHGTRIRRIPPTVLCLLSGDTNEIKGFPCCQDKSFPPSIHPRSRQRAMFAFRMHVLPTRILIGDDSGIPPRKPFHGVMDGVSHRIRASYRIHALRLSEGRLARCAVPNPSWGRGAGATYGNRSERRNTKTISGEPAHHPLLAFR